METSHVELQEIPVLRVRADMKGKGPSAAFNRLESKLPTIKGRKFYGTFQPTPDGEEYYACVVRSILTIPGKCSWRRERSRADGTPAANSWTGRSTSPSCPVSSKKWLA